MNATTTPGDASAPGLKRVVGVPSAVLMGLGSILGTGIFVSIGIAAGFSTTTYRVALALAGVVVLTAIVAGGIGRSNRANTIIVALTLLALAGFVVFVSVFMSNGPQFFMRIPPRFRAWRDSGDNDSGFLSGAMDYSFRTRVRVGPGDRRPSTRSATIRLA